MLLLIIVIPLYIAGSIWYTGRNSELVKGDVILVMGAAQLDGRPGDILLARLKQSKAIFKLSIQLAQVRPEIAQLRQQLAEIG